MDNQVVENTYIVGNKFVQGDYMLCGDRIHYCPIKAIESRDKLSESSSMYSTQQIFIICGTSIKPFESEVHGKIRTDY